MKAKKSLGQNFLNEPLVVEEILNAGSVHADDFILEVGPGKGMLTEALLKKAQKVVAVEKDNRMIPFLQERFKKELENNHLELIHGDILELQPHLFLDNPYKLIANIPYYITGELLRMFLELPQGPERMVIMVQKEVAERIVASDGKESILSISVKAYGHPTYITTVPAHSFTPSPKVDSAILRIDSLSKSFFTDNNLSEKHFFEVVKVGFSHKRKVLIKNLEKCIQKDVLLGIFDELSLPKTIRAEEMTLENWKNIAKISRSRDVRDGILPRNRLS